MPREVSQGTPPSLPSAPSPHTAAGAGSMAFSRMGSDKLALPLPPPSVGGGQPFVALQGSPWAAGSAPATLPHLPAAQRVPRGQHTARRIGRQAAETCVPLTTHFAVPCCTAMKAPPSLRQCAEHAEVVSRAQAFGGTQHRFICTEVGNVQGHRLCPTVRIARIVNETDRAQRTVRLEDLFRRSVVPWGFRTCLTTSMTWMTIPCGRHCAGCWFRLDRTALAT